MHETLVVVGFIGTWIFFVGFSPGVVVAAGGQVGIVAGMAE